MSKVYMGIDAGLDGGIATIQTSVYNKVMALTTNTLPMPTLKSGGKRIYDYNRILIYITEPSPPDYLLIESTPFIPIGDKGGTRQFSIKAIHSLAEFVGVIRGMCIALNIKHDTVPARTWQKHLFRGKSGNTKLLSIEYCRSVYPMVYLYSSVRSKKPHNGICDALCIADYARRIYNDNS